MFLSDVPRGTFSNALSMRRRLGVAVRLLAGVDPGSSSALSSSSPWPRSSPSVVCGRSSRTPAIHAHRARIGKACRILAVYPLSPGRQGAQPGGRRRPCRVRTRSADWQGTAARQTKWRDRTAPGTAPSADAGAAPASCRRRAGRRSRSRTLANAAVRADGGRPHDGFR